MKTSFLSVLTIAALFISSAHAGEEWLTVGDASFGEQGTSVEILDRTASFLDLSVTVPGVRLVDGQDDAAGYTHLEIPGEGNLGEVGHPALPTISRWVAVPAGATVRVEVLEVQSTTVDVGAIMPAQPTRFRDRPEPHFTVDQRIYGQAGWMQLKEAAAGSVQVMRDQSMVRIELRPVQYAPATGLADIASSMRVRVHFDGAYSSAQRSGSTAAPLDRLFSHQLLGYASRPVTRTKAREGILIVTTEEMVGAMSDLTTWKTMRGMDVEVLTLTGQPSPEDAVDTVHKHIEDSDVDFSYLLLAGDETIVPTVRRDTFDYDGVGETDLPYAMVTDDDMPDLMIGRFAARTSEQLETMSARVIQYERDLTEGSWIPKATGIASAGASGYGADYERMGEILDNFENYGFTHTDRFFEGSWSRYSEIIPAINEGRSWVSFMGHGSGTGWYFEYDWDFAFTNDDLEGLDNAGRWPVVIDVACNNGDFTNVEPSFAEAWTRAGTPEAPMGALATYSSTIAAAWDEPAEMSEGITDAFLNGRHAYWGEAILNGLLHMEAFFGQNYTTTETKFTFMNFGDPSMRLRSMAPITVEASYDQFVSEQGFGVTVVDADGAPVPDATVAISTDSGLLDVQLTNADGQVSFLMLDETTEAPFTLVVTGFDLVSIVEDVTLVHHPEGEDAFGSLFESGAQLESAGGNHNNSGTPGQPAGDSATSGEVWSAGGCSTTAASSGSGQAALWVLLGGLLLGTRRRS